MSTATLHVGTGGEGRAELLTRLMQQSNGLEQRFLRFLDKRGYQLPDTAQQIVEGYYVRPDFAYHRDGMDVAVFIDGPIHDRPRQAEKDRTAQARLENEAGWLVLRFHYQDGRGEHLSWQDIVASHPGVFGTGSVVS